GTVGTIHDGSTRIEGALQDRGAASEPPQSSYDLLSRRAIYQDQQFDFVGSDPASGEAMLRDPLVQPREAVKAKYKMFDDDLATGRFKEVRIGDETYYSRAADGTVFKLDQDNYGSFLVLQDGLIAAPSENVRLRSEPIDAQRSVGAQELSD